MTLTESDLSELLAALKAGEMDNKIRTSLEWILQQLIEAEATSVIGAGRYERSEEEMLSVWNVAVEETRALVAGDWV